MLNYTENGLWLSLVERLVRDQEAVGSNPTSPIALTRFMPSAGVEFAVRSLVLRMVD